MTCIVGLVHDGVVYMGGDSAGVRGYDLTQRKDTKVFKNGPFLFGFTSSFRMGQLLQYKFNPPLHHESVDTHRFMATDFIEAVRHCLKEGGYARVVDGEESAGQFLVGYRGRLFTIDIDYQVGESIHPYDAVGCGEQIALGCMYANSYLNVSPEDRILQALRAAEQLSAGVRSPFTILNTKEETT